MCLIALSATGFAEIPDDFWRHACAHNAHGFGVMYHDGAQLRIRSHLVYDLGTVRAEIAALPAGVRAAVHFRNATFGARDGSNVHPQVLTLYECSFMTLAVMHNGCLPQMSAGADDGPSDTALLVHGWLRNELRPGPRWWRSAEFQRKLTRFVGPNNRLVLLDSDGHWRRIGGEEGFDIGGTWISNAKSRAWLPAFAQREPVHS